MLAMHPDCQRCGADLPADAGGAFICSMEGTYCAACADARDGRCPGCGGELLDRPTRVGAALKKHSAATQLQFRR